MPDDILTPNDSLEPTQPVNQAQATVQPSAAISQPVAAPAPTATNPTASQPAAPAPPRLASFLQNKLIHKIGLASAILLAIIAILVASTVLYQRTHKTQLTQSQQVAQVKDQSVKLKSSPVSLQSDEATSGLRVGVATLYVNGDLSVQGQVALSSGPNTARLTLATQTANQTYVLPNASGTLCLSTNNCGFATQSQLVNIQTTVNGGTELVGGSGIVIANRVVTNSGVLSVNGSVSAINIQGTANQVLVTNNDGTISLALQQDLGPGSTPSFAGVTLTSVGSQNGHVICDDSNNCGYGGGNNDLVQGGNSFANANVVVGATDAGGVSLLAGNQVRLAITGTGDITLGSSSTNSVTFQASTIEAPNNLSIASTLFVNSSSQTVAIGNLPASLAGNRTPQLYVATNGNADGGILVNVAGAPGILSSPVGITSDGSTSGTVTLYVSDSDTNRINVYSVTGGTNTLVNTFGQPGSGDGQLMNPSGITYYGGDIYVAEIGNSRVQVFDSSGNYLRQFGTYGSGNGQLNTPFGVAVASNGDTYVSDNGNSRVQVFDSSGNYLRQFGAYGSGNGQLQTPGGLTLSNDGTLLYVADISNHRIEVFNASTGAYVSQFGGATSAPADQMAAPTGVSVDSAGNIWTIDLGAFTKVIRKYNPSGITIASGALVGTTTGRFNQPYGIFVDRGSGNIFAADTRNQRVQIYSPSIVYQGLINSSSNSSNSPVLQLANNSTPFFTVNDTGQLTSSTISPMAGAFQINDSLGVSLFSVDSAARNISLGPSSATPTLLTLGISNTASDPAGSAGQIYYNANTGKFRCYQGSAWANCVTGGAGTGDVNNGGNNYGATMSIGTLGNNDLNILTNGATVGTFSKTGNFGVNNTAPANRININVPTTGDSKAQLLVSTGATTNKGIVVQRVSGQTADLYENQTSTAAVLSGFGANGGLFTNGVSSSLNALAAPVINSVVASPTGGSLAAGTYYYGVTASNAAGQTALVASASSVTTTGSTSSVTVNWGAVPGATSFNVYRQLGSASFGPNSLVSTVVANGSSVTSYGLVDSGNATTSGQPGANPAGTTLNLQAWGGQTNSILQVQSASGTNLTSLNANGSLNVTDGTATNGLLPTAVSLNGVPQSFNFSTGDSGGAHVTGDISIAVRATMPQWGNGASEQALIGKYDGTAANSGYLLSITSTGQLHAYFSVGGSIVSASSTAPVGFAAGTSGFVAVTRSASTGQVCFYTGPNMLYLTLLGTCASMSTGALAGGNLPVQIGLFGVSSGSLQGKIYQATVYNSLSFTAPVIAMTASDAPSVLSTSWSSLTTGETWTLTGTAKLVTAPSQVMISSNNGASTAITIQSATDQYSDLFQAMTAAGNSLFGVAADGSIHNSGTHNSLGGGTQYNANLTVSAVTGKYGIMVIGTPGSGMLQGWEDSSYNLLASVSGTGEGAFSNLLQAGNQVCDNTNNCNFAQLNPTDFSLNGVVYYNGSKLVSTGSGLGGQCLLGATGAAPSWSSCAAGSGSGDINQGGNSFGQAVNLGATDAYGVNLLANNHVVASFSNSGAAKLQNSADSTTAFQIQNAAGTSLFTADTANSVIYIGNPTPSATATLLVLSNKNTAGDPAGINGAMYYNSSAQRFRCYQGSVWSDCINSSQTLAKSADQAITSTSYVNVNDLSFAVVSGKNYSLTCSLLMSVPSTSGAYLSMSAPGGQFTATFAKTGDQTAGDTYATSDTLSDPSPSSISKVTSQTGNRFLLRYNALISGVTTTGSWQLVARSADGTAITVYANSSCTLQPL